MELNGPLEEPTEEEEYTESDHTRPSMEEDFPNFRSFQIVKMVKHFRVITDGSDQRLRLGFKCKTCGHTFNKTMQLLGHIRMHFEDEHTCRECGKYFFDPNKLSTHIKAKHTVSMVKCQLGCTKFTTTTFKCLQLHYERYHFVKIRMREMRKMDEAIRSGGTVMTELVNSQPKRKRSRRGQLKINDEESQESLEEVAVEQAEPEQRPEPAEPEDCMPASSDGEIIADECTVSDQMQCCVCGAIFGNEQQLALHESTHTSPFECSFCETEFLELEEIREHYQSKHQMVGSATQFVITSTHPASQLQVQSQPHQMQQHQHHHQLQLQHQQHPQQQVHHIAPTAQFIPNQNPGAMTTMLVMQNGMLIPVQTIDSSQLAAVNSFPQTSITQIGQNQIAWPITATPITSNHHPQAQQVLPPVHNQIEIIPLHGPAPVTQAGTPVSAVCIAPQHLQTAGGGGSYVINSIASIDPSYLKQVDAVTVQQHQQHQQQQQQQQQQQHQQQQQQQQQFQQQLHSTQQLHQQQYHT